MKETIPYLGADAVDGSSAQTGALIASFGGITDWSLLGSDTVSPTFVRETYYVRTRASPLFFTFSFYKPDAAWRAVDIQFGTYYNEKSNGHLVESTNH